MKLDLYKINSFTDDISKGNPACVIRLKKWLSDDVLLKIAKKNAVAETAFLIKNKSNFHLRWFTPEIEMDLCGHATLAAAHCLKSILDYKNNQIIFETLSGELKVGFDHEYYLMDLPSRMPIVSHLPEIIMESLNILPKEVYKSRDYLLVYENENQINNVKINKVIFDKINLDPGGVIVTSRGDNCDFVSRYFTPQSSVLEDPVTGSSHCSLTPFWAKRLNKESLVARQISERGGALKCLNNGNRVTISGKAKTCSIGKILIQ